MPRHPRVHEPQLLFHIMARGNNKQKIFESPKDYDAFLVMLRKSKKRYPFKLYAYALMSNHIHLLVEVGEKPSARIMQSLLTGYARHFNRTYKRTGHLFQGRYKAILCEKDAYAMELVRYIHLNPLRAHIAKEINEWKWTGHGEYSGKVKQDLIDPGVVVELFGKGALGAAKYKEFMADGLWCKYDEDLHPSDASPFLGSERFKEAVLCKTKPKELRKQKSLHDIIADEIKGSGLSMELIIGKNRKKDIAAVRKTVIRKAVMEYGHAASALSRQMNCSEAYISKVLS